MSFPQGYQGQANTTVSDAIATAANPGVTPPDYTTANHYHYHKMMGQNVRCTPLLLGMESPIIDTVYPTHAQLLALGLVPTSAEPTEAEGSPLNKMLGY